MNEPLGGMLIKSLDKAERDPRRTTMKRINKLYSPRYLLQTNKKLSTGSEKSTTQKQKVRDWNPYKFVQKRPGWVSWEKAQYESRATYGPQRDSLTPQSILLRPNCQYILNSCLISNGFEVACKDIWNITQENTCKDVKSRTMVEIQNKSKLKKVHYKDKY